MSAKLMPAKGNWDTPEAHIERRGFCCWYIVYPAGFDGGMGMEAGPYLTRWGAHLSRWFSAALDTEQGPGE